jgi:CheY-like chemotaxis protein
MPVAPVTAALAKASHVWLGRGMREHSDYSRAASPCRVAPSWGAWPTASCARPRTGQQALALAVGGVPDAGILDLGLPDIDHTEFIVELRRGYRRPIIVLSSRTSIGDKISALDAGADDYVTKPFAMGELLALISRAESTLDPERTAAMLFRDYFLTLGQLSPAISEAAYQTARLRQGPELTDNDRLMILSIIALGEIHEAI